MTMKIKILTSAQDTHTNLKDDRARSLIKCVYVLVLMKDESTCTTSQTKILRDNILNALSFLKDHKLGSLAWKTLFQAALAKRDFSKLSAELDAVFVVMRTKNKAYASNSFLTNLYVQILKDFRAYVRSDSDQAYARLEKNAKETEEPSLFARILPEKQDVSVQVRSLRRIIKKYDPENSTLTLAIDVAKTLREEDLPTYKMYLKIKGDIKKSMLKELMAFVRQSGSKLVSTDSVVKYLKKLGMPSTVQEGFVGQIDESGNFFTVKGKTTPGRQLKTTPAGKCFMNPAYDPDLDNTYVLKSYTPGATGDAGSFYTKDFGATSQVDKYSKVEDNIPLFDAARNKWIKDVIYEKGEKSQYARLCEMAYISMARIGSKNVNMSNKGVYAGKSTFGIRTLLCKHVRVTPERIIIAYLGVKTSAKLKHYVYKDTAEGKALYAYIAKRVETYGKNDPLFAYQGKMASTTKLNAYIKSLGLTITIHKFRTIRGTLLFDKLVAKSKVLSAKTTTQPKVVESTLKSVLENVGKELGHYSTSAAGETKITGTTALQSYIIPSHVIAIYDRLHIRYPTQIQKLVDDMKRGGKDDDDDD